MNPARVNFGIRPGTTFVEQVILALDENNEPVDLTGCIPYAQVRDEPEAAPILDLNLALITSGTLADPVTVDPLTDEFTLLSHGLKAGMCVQFVTSGTLPAPLTLAGFYIVMGEGLSEDVFKVMTLANALADNETSVNITTAGTGTLQAIISVGQISMPEISYQETEQLPEYPLAGWDLMIEDPLARRLAPFITGSFPISRGFTDPDYLT